jgi:predicted alpha/beta superfamily hydrolase
VTVPRIKGWLPYEQVHGKHNSVTGTVYVWPSLNSPELSRSREIAVYLPPSLASGEGGERQYPVIYFHDGQNVFDSHTSYVGEWQADETLEKLAEDGIEAIAVAVPNAGEDRMDEYSPWRGRSGFGRRRVGGHGDAYLKWLVEEVKPLVDRSFPTRHDRVGTGTIGSSLGGLISLYAVVRYPNTFGFVGAMSPSLRWHDYKIVDFFDGWRGPRPRIHLDMGGREFKGLTEDARQMRDMLLANGWSEGTDLSYVEDRYGHHHEDAWARRLPDALRFLLADAVEDGAADEPAEPKSAA